METADQLVRLAATANLDPPDLPESPAPLAEKVPMDHPVLPEIPDHLVHQVAKETMPSPATLGRPVRQVRTVIRGQTVPRDKTGVQDQKDNQEKMLSIAPVRQDAEHRLWNITNIIFLIHSFIGFKSCSTHSSIYQNRSVIPI